MEPADIDWKRLEWRFEKDDTYEHFNAPKWVDLSSSPLSTSSSGVPVDEAWFCRPECSHPKTAEDFLSLMSSTPDNRKIGMLSPSPLGEKKLNKNSILRDANLKKRCAPPFSVESPKSKPAAKMRKSREDLENRDPNIGEITPERSIAKNPLKEAIKSSAERPKPQPERHLVSKKVILSQLSEFCSEIKKLAMPRKDHTHTSEVEPDLKNQRDGKLGKEKTIKAALTQEIRSCPPTPQRIAFSPVHKHQGKLKETVEEDVDDAEIEKGTKTPASTESKSLDLFWFIKPCVKIIHL